MLITTMNDVPGYTIDEVFGEVFGLTVRSRNIGSQFGAGLKSILGGELKGMTKALETGTFLEINSQPDRLDLTDVHARAAREAGLKLVIDSDGHQLSALDYVELGVGQARRAWLTKKDVVNTHTWKQIEKLRKKRP